MSSINLIVKAPNQKVEDQTFECYDNWNVLQLKQHLAVVYPTKPVSSIIIVILIISLFSFWISNFKMSQVKNF